MAGVDDLVCFSLYRASQATTRTYRRLLAPWKLTYPQFLVLVELWTGGPATVSRLGERLALDSGTLSPLLRRMEQAGHVRRERGEDDGRVVTVHLTDTGAALRGEMSSVAAELARCAGLTADTAVALRTSLHRLSSNLDASSAG